MVLRICYKGEWTTFGEGRATVLPADLVVARCASLRSIPPGLFSRSSITRVFCYFLDHQNCLTQITYLPPPGTRCTNTALLQGPLFRFC